MPVADYDLCIITQERFSPDTSSELCPVVGECGHSFTRQGIQNWYEGRKTDEYHKRKSHVPCAYKCARKWVNKKGHRMEEQIRAFKASDLVPNFALCEAVAVIRRVEAGKAEKGNEDFVHCSLCQNNYSAEAATAGLQHHPRAPVVGVCGHTFCASCIYDKHQEAMQDSNCDSLRYVQCPHCHEKGAFHTDRLVLNLGLKDALIYWEEIAGPIDYKDLYRKEKAKCDALNELHGKEMGIQRDLLKKKTAEYEALKVKLKGEMEALDGYKDLYERIKIESEVLKVERNNEIEKYEALKYQHKGEKENLIAYYEDLYEKKRSECNALKAEYNNERQAKMKLSDFSKRKIEEYENLMSLFKKKTNEYNTLKARHDKEMENKMNYRDLDHTKTSECDALRGLHDSEIEELPPRRSTAASIPFQDKEQTIGVWNEEERKALKKTLSKSQLAAVEPIMLGFDRITACYENLYEKKRSEWNAQEAEYNNEMQAKIEEMSMEDAHVYLDNVKQAFGEEQPERYKEFLTILKNLPSHNKDIPGLVEKVCKLCCGHNSLILGFNKFLPNGQKIKLSDVDKMMETSHEEDGSYMDHFENDDGSIAAEGQMEEEEMHEDDLRMVETNHPSGSKTTQLEADGDETEAVDTEKLDVFNKKGKKRGLPAFETGERIFLSQHNKGLGCSVSSHLAGLSAMVLDYKEIGSWMTVKLMEGPCNIVKIRKGDATRDATKVQYSTNIEDGCHEAHVLGLAKKKQKLCPDLADSARVGESLSALYKTSGGPSVNFNIAQDNIGNNNKTKEVYRGPPMNALANDQFWPEGWIQVSKERPKLNPQGKVRVDHYWISPCKKTFRSMVSVQEFLLKTPKAGITEAQESTMLQKSSMVKEVTSKDEGEGQRKKEDEKSVGNFRKNPKSKQRINRTLNGEAADDLAEDDALASNNTQHTAKNDAPRVPRRVWTKEENDALLSGIQLHGKKWKDVAAMVKTRSANLCKARAQKIFGKMSEVQKIHDLCDAAAKTGNEEVEDSDSGDVCVALNPTNSDDIVHANYASDDGDDVPIVQLKKKQSKKEEQRMDFASEDAAIKTKAVQKLEESSADCVLQPATIDECGPMDPSESVDETDEIDVDAPPQGRINPPQFEHVVRVPV